MFYSQADCFLHLPGQPTHGECLRRKRNMIESCRCLVWLLFPARKMGIWMGYPGTVWPFFVRVLLLYWAEIKESFNKKFFSSGNPPAPTPPSRSYPTTTKGAEAFCMCCAGTPGNSPLSPALRVHSIAELAIYQWSAPLK